MSENTDMNSRAFCRTGRTGTGTHPGMVREMDRSTLTAGITPPFGNAALHHNVPVEDAANGIRNGFIVIITFD